MSISKGVFIKRSQLLEDEENNNKQKFIDY